MSPVTRVLAFNSCRRDRGTIDKEYTLRGLLGALPPFCRILQTHFENLMVVTSGTGPLFKFSLLSDDLRRHKSRNKGLFAGANEKSLGHSVRENQVLRTGMTWRRENG
jgi:hypothetical protein